jgi:outer membrane biosynthesis protein TonB
MQRDIGNEVIVAIVVVSVLAFALTFGIIISLSNTNAGTVVQSNVATDAPSETIVPSVTDGPTDAPTATDEPTDEPTATDAPTNVATATDEPTDEPTDTPEPTDAPTATDQPTEINEPAKTVEVGVASVPSDTPTTAPTVTLTQTRASQPTATFTASATVTRTPTKAPTVAQTSTAAATLMRTPTSTGQSVVSSTSPTTVSVCIAPFGWVVYQVRPGDTMVSIAQLTGSTVDGLRASNCLASINQIREGDRLYVPGVPAVEPSVSGLEVQGCTDGSTQISGPDPGDRVRGSFTLVGTAAQSNFAYYQIEIRPDTSNTFNFYARSVNPVVDGILGTIDLRVYGTGLHWVRLSIVNDGGMVTTRPCAIPLYFE